MDLSTAIWRKSTRSSDNGGLCVEVATNLPGVVAIRDSKNPLGCVLVVGTDAFAQFTAAVKAGVFDLA